MENEKENESLFLGIPQTLDPVAIPSLELGLRFGLGLGLGCLFLAKSQSLKPLSTAIKLADGAIKGSTALQTLHSPSPQTLILTSKALIKGFKASNRLIPGRWKAENLSIATTRLKPYLAALNLVRYAGSPLVADGSLGLGFLRGGYKLSKNSLRVLEGFAGFQLNSTVKKGIDAFGLLVKAVVVAREVEKRWIVFGRWRRSRNGLGFRKASRWSCGVCWRRCEILDFDRVCRRNSRRFNVEGLPFRERALVRGRALEQELNSHDIIIGNGVQAGSVTKRLPPYLNYQ